VVQGSLSGSRTKLPVSRFRHAGGTTGNGSGRLKPEATIMTIGTVLLVVLILLLIGALPTWPHSKSWGYWPGGLLGTIVIILLILLLLGRI